MSVKKNLEAINKEIPSHVTLVAVSKFKPIEAIKEAYDAGQRHFGENKVQEMLSKQPQLPADICWHLIGHLQTNKVKYIVPFVHLIQSIDSVKLLDEVEKQAAKLLPGDRKINVLLQIHIADEETKFGFDTSELEKLTNEKAFEKYQKINFCGVMGMATFTENMAQVRSEFRRLKKTFEQLKAGSFASHPEFTSISMGMSGDYKEAIEEGSTIVRVGTAIFGERQYT